MDDKRIEIAARLLGDVVPRLGDAEPDTRRQWVRVSLALADALIEEAQHEQA